MSGYDGAWKTWEECKESLDWRLREDTVSIPLLWTCRKQTIHTQSQFRIDPGDLTLERKVIMTKTEEKEYGFAEMNPWLRDFPMQV